MFFWEIVKSFLEDADRDGSEAKLVEAHASLSDKDRKNIEQIVGNAYKTNGNDEAVSDYLERRHPCEDKCLTPLCERLARYFVICTLRTE